MSYVHYVQYIGVEIKSNIEHTVDGVAFLDRDPLAEQFNVWEDGHCGLGEL